MDNASKALIMAGAIFIAVSIIGVGIYIISATDLMTDSATNQIDALKVTGINAQLSHYEGEKSGAQVKLLVNLLCSMNIENKFPSNEAIKFKLDDAEAVEVFTNSIEGIEDDKKYSIAFSYSDTGYINQVVCETID